MGQAGLRVENRTRQCVLVSQGRVAATHWTRLRGLIGVKELAPGDGLLIRPCNSIHCMFMSIPIDVIYVGEGDVVLDVDPGMKPWAIGRPRKGGRYVLELRAGAIAASGTRPGDRLALSGGEG